MLFEQFKVNGLGCYSYLIGCPGAGTACVVDPERHVERYIDMAEKENVRITAIFDTHVHADHITGTQELAKRTGAPIYIHPGAEAEYEHTPVKEGDVYTFGNARLEAIYTPGHTPNSISLAVTDLARGEEPFGILTGDVLFVGDIGRPDLAGEDLLEQQIKNLYDSLYNKLGSYPDWTEIYPAHGQGSLCGKGMSAKPMTTLGFERRHNKLLGMSFEEFHDVMAGEFELRPSNFMCMVDKNRQGPALISESPEPVKMTLDHVEDAVKNGAVLVDIRKQTSFGAAFVYGSLNIGLSPNSVNWLGAIVPADKELIILAENKTDALDAIWQFQRAGYDNIIGYVDNGVSSWASRGKPLNYLPQLSVESLFHVLDKYKDHKVLDVRTAQERKNGYIEGSEHVPINELIKNGPDQLGYKKDTHVTVVCQSGYRANIAGSYLKAQGYTHIFILIGGFGAWQNYKKNK
jgi:hydroxyacylglutathione hydrolase